MLVTTVYVNHRSNKSDVAIEIANHILNLENSAPDALQVINGDFNHCSLETNLPNFYQQITCFTRKDPSTEVESTLDLFYCNVKDAYVCTRLSPLGRSDHNLISLLPRYRPRVKREPPTTRVVQQWTADACDSLIGCMEITAWSVFTEQETDINTIVDTVSSYVSWCVECIIPVKEVKVFANNKPWVNKDVKSVLKEKKKCFKDNNRDKILMKNVQNKLDASIKKGKKQYKEKIEQKFEANDMKKVWEGMNLMGGRSAVNRSSVFCNSKKYANELNNFYARFDCHDFSKDIQGVRN